jgi:hypothetical protein
LTEPLRAEALGLSDAVCGGEIGRIELLEYGAERGRIGPLKEETGLTFDNRFKEPAGSQCDHRPP